MIEVEQLSRCYGDFQAVREVSFRIGRGEVVGLLGHNGAGKTTIMKMLTGFLEPTGGTIRIRGLDLRCHRRAVQARIGYLPENCPLYPEMTVLDYLDYRAALQGIPPQQRPAAIRRAVERTALAPKAGAPIATLSRGYRQRVGVAQAILHEPEILILDEPTNGLDPTQILHMRQLIRTLAERATLILSTHILQEVSAVCDRVLLLRAGRLALDARLEELAAPHRLLITLDQPPEAAMPRLQALASDCTLAEEKGPRYTYALGFEDPLAAAPRVARTIGEAGWALYELTPERRDLETLFGLYNSEVAHA